MILEGKNVVLRPIRLDEAEAFRRQADDKVVAEYLGVRFPHPYKIEDAHFWINRVAEGHAKGTPVNFGIARQSDDAIMGCTGLDGETTERTGQPALGYWIGADYRGQQYVQEAAQLIMDFAFNALNLPQLDATVATDNAPSQRVIEKLGFRFVKDFTRDPSHNHRGWTDFKFYSLARQQWQQLNNG